MEPLGSKPPSKKEINDGELKRRSLRDLIVYFGGKFSDVYAYPSLYHGVKSNIEFFNRIFNEIAWRIQFFFQSVISPNALPDSP